MDGRVSGHIYTWAALSRALVGRSCCQAAGELVNGEELTLTSLDKLAVHARARALRKLERDFYATQLLPARARAQRRANKAVRENGRPWAGQPAPDYHHYARARARATRQRLMIINASARTCLLVVGAVVVIAGAFGTRMALFFSGHEHTERHPAHPITRACARVAQ